MLAAPAPARMGAAAPRWGFRVAARLWASRRWLARRPARRRPRSGRRWRRRRRRLPRGSDLARLAHLPGRRSSSRSAWRWAWWEAAGRRQARWARRAVAGWARRRVEARGHGACGPPCRPPRCRRSPRARGQQAMPRAVRRARGRAAGRPIAQRLVPRIARRRISSTRRSTRQMARRARRGRRAGRAGRARRARMEGAPRRRARVLWAARVRWAPRALCRQAVQRARERAAGGRIVQHPAPRIGLRRKGSRARARWAARGRWGRCLNPARRQEIGVKSRAGPRGRRKGAGHQSP